MVPGEHEGWAEPDPIGAEPRSRDEAGGDARPRLGTRSLGSSAWGLETGEAFELRGVVWTPKTQASRAPTGGKRGIPKGCDARSRPRHVTRKALQSRNRDRRPIPVQSS
ncbi:hypothetical protein GUJ93_ZPchr0012g19211 [Zizania palustris]|uniref:Uncharacterized protein n=1 Tax=Zizania palustris TaxID=103762 RepID=A0A8J5WM93_ZIZPA|nr:hypothetical protein GUJ93_ZPchr0012g19211 [Zizania palustris]